MRVQEGSWGWRVAQVSDLRSGWAGAVIGPMVDKEAGKVWLLGKRIGETNGLDTFVSLCEVIERGGKLTDSLVSPFLQGCQLFRIDLAKGD